MFGNQVEDQYINQISASDAAAQGRSQWPVLTVLALGIGALLIWAALFEIEEVTTGLGRVIPSKQVQLVQTLEGGILSSISVQEGDIVEQGSVLMQIDDTGFSSRLGELQEQESSLLSEKYRLEAEASLSDELKFPADFQTKNKGAMTVETAVFKSRKIQLAGEIEVLKNRLTQREAAITELAATRRKLETTLNPLTKEVTLTRKLFKRGLVPEVEFLRLQSRHAELKGDLEVAKSAVPKLEASLLEIENQLKSTKSAYVLTARERLAKLQGELAVVQETMRGATDRVTRTQLKSPVRGIVNKINMNTIGSVVQPGRDIIEIVPLDDGLLIEAEIRPQDVAFIKTGETASVKLTAYDYLIYGALVGTVQRIGADTIADKNGDEFFKVIVRTEQNYLGDKKKKYPIIPGMVASVDIQTGRKTVMTYLLKPILRARAEAFRER